MELMQVAAVRMMWKIILGILTFAGLLILSLGAWWLLARVVHWVFCWNKIFGAILMFVLLIVYSVMAGYAKTGEQFSRKALSFSKKEK